MKLSEDFLYKDFKRNIATLQIYYYSDNNRQMTYEIHTVATS